jgi:hypothetical protein
MLTVCRYQQHGNRRSIDFRESGFLGRKAFLEPTMGHARSTARPARASHRFAATAILAMLIMNAQAQGTVLRTHQAEYPQHTAAEYALTNNRATASSLHVLGDYYFFDGAPLKLGPTLGSLVGGLRASTGVVGLSQPLSLYDTRPDPLQSQPYIGLGYSHLWFNSQLSLNADFGLASQAHGHGLFNSASTVDDANTQLHWSPVMAVNVRYSF